MKKYAVTLKEIIDIVNLAKDKELIIKNLKFWFKASKPITKIAEGKIDSKYNTSCGVFQTTYYVGDEKLDHIIEFLKLCRGKNIKIYIEESK
jgi:hypothetical protein